MHTRTATARQSADARPAPPTAQPGIRCAAANPFRVSRVEALPYRATGFSWPLFFARLEAAGMRGAVCGPHGSGKTTLLLELGERLARQGTETVHLFLNEESPRHAWLAPARHAAARGAFVLFDGAEQLNFLAWRRFLGVARRFSGLVATCHRPGRLPLLWETATEPGLMLELLDELVGPPPRACREQAAQAWQRHDGNVREVFASLYDDWADGTF